MGKQHSDIKDFDTKSRRKMVVIINLEKTKELPSISVMWQVVCYWGKEDFIIGF